MCQHRCALDLFEIPVGVSTQFFGLESIGELKVAWKNLGAISRINIDVKRWNSLGEENSWQEKSQDSNKNSQKKLQKFPPEFSDHSMGVFLFAYS